MAGTMHTHGSAAPHEHANAAPGHTHDAQGNVAPAAGTAAAGTGAAAGTAAAAPAAAEEHRHKGIGTHAHADARPGHEHEEERTVRERPGGGMAGRLIFGLVGVAGMIIGPFLPWVEGTRGTAIELRALFSSESGEAGFLVSAGFAVLVLGVIALIGLLFRSGWLTSLAAALGLVATVLVAVFRFGGEGGGLSDLDYGWWISAVGSLLALIASMFAARTRVVETRRTV
jgi:hypothetical protein